MTSTADTVYLQEKNVANLLDDMVDAVLGAKPADVESYLAEWLSGSDAAPTKLASAGQTGKAPPPPAPVPTGNGNGNGHANGNGNGNGNGHAPAPPGGPPAPKAGGGPPPPPPPPPSAAFFKDLSKKSGGGGDEADAAARAALFADLAKGMWVGEVKGGRRGEGRGRGGRVVCDIVQSPHCTLQEPTSQRG